MNPGRPTLLDEHLFRKIRELVLDGNNLRQVSEALEIPYATMRDWEYENYKSFSDKMLSYKHERMLLKAESNVEVLMSAEDDRVKLDASKFTLEALNKKFYSKRVEQTGADGKELPVPILQINYENKGTDSQIQQGTLQETRSDSESESSERTEETKTEGVQENRTWENDGEQIQKEIIPKEQVQAPIFEVWNNN